MEKILVNRYGEAISFNTDLNAITPMLANIDCHIYKAETDGQVITSDEVIDIKKGEFALVCVCWNNGKNVVKAIVISDPAAIHDLGEWYEFELNKYKSNESC